MKALHICTPVFYKSTHKARYLIESCRRTGNKIECFGIGNKWEGFVKSKMFGLRDHLESIESKYILCLDAVDTIVTVKPEAIVEAYLEAVGEKSILISGDRFCFPHLDLKDAFTKKFGFVREYRYPCAGVIMGERKALIDAISIIGDKRAMCPDWMPGFDDDQGWWQTALANKWVNYEVDHKCKLALSFLKAKLCWFEREGPVVSFEGSPTCVLHFNGAGLGKMTKTMWAYLESEKYDVEA